MMLVITPDDFRKLSSSCREELISFLARNAKPRSRDEGYSEPLDSEDSSADQYPQAEQEPTTEDVPEEKQRLVVDIDVDEARMLVANISEKSLQTLHRFALGEPVALDELIGSACPYRDLVDLKRSFVGAVNRRLRTVMEKRGKNRLAYLFTSIRGDETRFKITARSAVALRQVLRRSLPEDLKKLASRGR